MILLWLTLILMLRKRYRVVSWSFSLSLFNLFRSRCRRLTKVLPRSSWNLQNQNDANASNSIRSRTQFFRLLLWNYQFASAGLSLSQTGRCCCRDDDEAQWFYFVFLVLHKTVDVPTNMPERKTNTHLFVVEPSHSLPSTSVSELTIKSSPQESHREQCRLTTHNLSCFVMLWMYILVLCVDGLHSPPSWLLIT